jgi:pepF/M3 family oligoendopeptidase
MDNIRLFYGENKISVLKNNLGGFTMKLRWNLDSLYTSFDSEEFEKDLAQCMNMIKTIASWTENNLKDITSAKDKLENYISMITDFDLKYGRLMSFANLSLSVDAKNEQALQVIERLQKAHTDLTKPQVNFRGWLGSLGNLEEIISSSQLLKEHKFYISEIVERNRYTLSEKEEIIIAKMANTGADSWSKLQQKLSSTLLVDIHIKGEDKKLPLPVVRNMAYDEDGAVRKTAFEAELMAYNKIAESSAAALNGIKGEVLTVSKLRGYKSPLEQTVLNSRMDEKTLNAMLTAMKESLPAFQKYFRKKGEILGYNNGLPFYDLFAPLGSVNKSYTYEEAREFIVNNFRTFSSKLADFADKAFENQWIDAEPRDGKRGGAFCSNLRSIKESRILTNFTGSLGNVFTLAHELGHGYHGECLKEETILNTRYPMPIAETASIFCETIVTNAALKSASEEEAFGILESSISHSGQVIVDILSRFLFESEVFRRREDHSLSVNELKDIMMNAQKETYGSGLDHNVLHPYMWVNKPHYYYPSTNFYNFPYAFGLLFALGLYSEYLKTGEAFVKKYDELLAATGKNKIAEITAMAGIDITTPDFWRSSLKLVEGDIDKFIELSNKRDK